MEKRCPKCGKSMLPYWRHPVELHRCDKCIGFWFDGGELEEYLGGPPTVIQENLDSEEVTATCPDCDSSLEKLKVAALPSAIVIDRCPKCRGVFLDFGELESLKAKSPRQYIIPDPGDPLEGYAHYSDFSQRELFSLITRLPVETENVLSRIPFVLYGLLTLIGAVWLWQFFVVGLEPSWEAYALIPDHVMAGRRIHTLLTNMFLHGGWVHVLSNLYFLWLFGDNVEDSWGPVPFGIVFLLWGLIASAGTVAISAHSDLPHVGASGAIAGVMGAYVVIFPKTRIIQGFGMIVLLLPAWVFVGGWFALQVFGAYTMGDASIAWSAHIIGLAAGVATALLWKVVRRPETQGGVGQPE